MWTATKKLRNALNELDLVTGIAVQVPHPGLVEIAATSGNSFVAIDVEHTAGDRTVVENMVRAADANGIACLVKLTRIDEIEVRSALDSGAHGVIAPHVRCAEDLQALIDYAFFPPRGKRGLCSAARANRHGSWDLTDLVNGTNDNLIVVPVLEDKEMVDNLEAILDVDDSVDIYEIGPVDLALSLGLDVGRSITNPSPELADVLDRVMKTLRDRGKNILYPSRFPNLDASEEDVREAMLKRGVKMVFGMDTHVLVKGFRDVAGLQHSKG